MAASILVVVIFGVDVVLPLGVGMCSLYLAPLIFLAIYSTPTQSSPVIVIAALSAILTGVGFFLSPPGPVWYAVANRFIVVSLIGMTVILSLVRKRAETEAKVLRGLLAICSSCKKIRDDGGYWQQVERYALFVSHAGSDRHVSRRLLCSHPGSCIRQYPVYGGADYVWRLRPWTASLVRHRVVTR